MNTKSLSYFAIAISLSFSPLVYSVSDEELSNQINDELDQGYGFDQVNFQVNNGVVILTGSVRTSDDKNKVENDVRNIEGVKELKSKIAVQARANRGNESAKDLFSTPADKLLNQEIRSKVSPGLFKNSYSDITLNTTNGVVTLNGYVKKAGDQEKLMTEIQKIEGVKTVKNRVIIQNP